MSREDWPLPVIPVARCPRCEKLVEVTQPTIRGSRWIVCLKGHVIRRVQREHRRAA